MSTEPNNPNQTLKIQIIFAGISSPLLFPPQSPHISRGTFPILSRHPSFYKTTHGSGSCNQRWLFKEWKNQSTPRISPPSVHPPPIPHPPSPPSPHPHPPQRQVRPLLPGCAEALLRCLDPSDPTLRRHRQTSDRRRLAAPNRRPTPDPRNPKRNDPPS